MPNGFRAAHHHANHPHAADGTHVIVDRSGTEGAHHDPCVHTRHDRGHHVPAPTLAPAKPARQGDPSQVAYTCPMHPQVRQIRSGSCPICGMALEPVMPATEPGGSAEPRDMTRRFWIGTALTLPVFALEMGGHLTDLNHLLGQQLSNWVQVPAAAGHAGRDVGGLALLRSRGCIGEKPQSQHALAVCDVCDVCAVCAICAGHGRGVAWLYSIVGTMAPHLFPASLRLGDGAVAIYFEAAAIITVLVLLGQVLELREREKTSGAIKALLALAPKTAVKVDAAGNDETVPVETIQAGDLLRVRPGEKVPVDGE